MASSIQHGMPSNALPSSMIMSPSINYNTDDDDDDDDDDDYCDYCHCYGASFE
jgi:hypothetical protein